MGWHSSWERTSAFTSEGTERKKMQLQTKCQQQVLGDQDTHTCTHWPAMQKLQKLLTYKQGGEIGVQVKQQKMLLYSSTLIHKAHVAPHCTTICDTQTYTLLTNLDGTIGLMKDMEGQLLVPAAMRNGRGARQL